VLRVDGSRVPLVALVLNFDGPRVQRLALALGVEDSHAQRLAPALGKKRPVLPGKQLRRRLLRSRGRGFGG